MLLKDAVQFAMQASNGAVIPLIDDMSDAPFAQPTQNGGNHPLWIVGHLTWVEGQVPRFCLERRAKSKSGRRLFGIGTAVVTDARSIRRSPRSGRNTKRCGRPTCELFESFTEADSRQKPTKVATAPSGKGDAHLWPDVSYARCTQYVAPRPVRWTAAAGGRAEAAVHVKRVRISNQPRTLAKEGSFRPLVLRRRALFLTTA